jgi:SAM-dependent methyltransferase
MKLPLGTPPVITYQCNICGTKNTLPTLDFYRELALCTYCGSNSRFRGLIYILAEFIGEDTGRPLQYWKIQKNISGLGMSDWSGYAEKLAIFFEYTNTFYDKSPMFDIQNVDKRHHNKYDFVICSDVFEHIVQPVQNGFDNLFKILKPNGRLIFSVPYTRTIRTLEHYPKLHEFKIIDFYGKNVLINRTKSGDYSIHDKLVFHGGTGCTLEMRLFCEKDIICYLENAGFRKIKIHDKPDIDVGFYWPQLYQENRSDPLLYAYIISANK